MRELLYNMLLFYFAAFLLCLWLAGRSLLPLLHRDFGSRTMWQLRVIAFVAFLASIAHQVFIYRNVTAQTLATVHSFVAFWQLCDLRIVRHFPVCFVLIGLIFLVWPFHELDASYNRHAGVIHSRSSGTPWPLWQRIGQSPSLARLNESLLCAFLGMFLIASLIDPLAGTWLIAGSIMLFIEGWRQSRLLRTRVRDTLDARLDAENLRAATDKRTRPRGADPGQFYDVDDA